MNRSDFIVALVLTAFGLFVVVESLRMPRFESIGGSIATAPGLVPGLLGGIILLFGVLMAVRAIASNRGSAAPPVADEPVADPSDDADKAVDDDEPVAEPEPPHAGWIRLAWILGLSLVYALVLIGRLPFWLATFLFVFSSIIVFERSSFHSARSIALRSAIATAIAIAVALTVPYVFERIFLVNLP